jgi:hypothetical protein
LSAAAAAPAAPAAPATSTAFAAIITAQPTLTADGFDTMYQASAAAGQTLVKPQSNISQTLISSYSNKVKVL